MWILAITALLSSLMIMMSGTTDFVRRERPDALLAMRVEAAKVAQFKRAADLYVAANPTASGNIFWSTIKTAPGMPSGIAGATIDSTWKIVANGSGGYTLCADIKPGTAMMLTDTLLFNKDVIAQKSTTGKIVMTGTSSQVETEAAKC